MNTSFRAEIHLKGDAADKTYCATVTSGAATSLLAFNTKCWDSSGDSLSADMIPSIDRIGIQVSSDDRTTYQLSGFCLTRIDLVGSVSAGTGGVAGSGGRSGGSGGAGGTTGTGGATGTGGVAPSTRPTACNDVSTMVATVTDAYGASTVILDNNPNKNYYFMANWWGKASGGTPNLSESINGLGFTVNNPNSQSSSDNNPMGFPTLFIGSYQGKAGKGSNLPKKVDALTSIPTILRTNSSTLDKSNFNATYDVWFTSGGTVSGSSPGSGGAYLMVWLFKPSNHQPRGSIARAGVEVANVPGVWNVWYDTTQSPPCVSYVAIQPIDELQFDLNDFIKDAVTNKWGVTNSQYLTVVFAGTEVWGGANGFQIKQFCLDVK